MPLIYKPKFSLFNHFTMLDFREIKRNYLGLFTTAKKGHFIPKPSKLQNKVFKWLGAHQSVAGSMLAIKKKPSDAWRRDPVLSRNVASLCMIKQIIWTQDPGVRTSSLLGSVRVTEPYLLQHPSHLLKLSLDVQIISSLLPFLSCSSGILPKWAPLDGKKSGLKLKSDQNAP